MCVDSLHEDERDELSDISAHLQISQKARIIMPIPIDTMQRTLLITPLIAPQTHAQTHT